MVSLKFFRLHLQCKYGNGIVEYHYWIIYFLSFFKRKSPALLSSFLLDQHCEEGRCKAILAEFLAATSRLAASHLAQTCTALTCAMETISDCAKLKEEGLRILEDLLDGHLDLVFNQHLANLISCCIYGSAR